MMLVWLARKLLRQKSIWWISIRGDLWIRCFFCSQYTIFSSPLSKLSVDMSWTPSSANTFRRCSSSAIARCLVQSRLLKSAPRTSSARRPVSPFLRCVTDHAAELATACQWCLPLPQILSGHMELWTFYSSPCWPFFFLLFFLHPPAPDCLLTPLRARWFAEWRQRRIWKLRRSPPS